MKTRIFILLSFISPIALSNGVGVIDATTGTYLKLVSGKVGVVVEDQVSMVTTTQIFKNTTSTEQKLKYAFPMSEGASATSLRWNIGDTWYNASFSSAPQDTTLPGSGVIVLADLMLYLGKTPLYFDIPQKLKPDSLLVVELMYVELLPYKNGNVNFFYPNNYLLIQEAALDTQSVTFDLSSHRTIDTLRSISHPGATITNSGNNATLDWEKIGSPADADYRFTYTLRATELGLFGLSTNLPDSLGYFAFIVEPNPQTGVDVLRKVFTLIIDRSGSMGWENKMEQAKNAASFIVSNLNEGDKFNLIDFDDVATSFRPSHVLFNPQSRDSALVYISGLFARDGTDIANAFGTAIPQFASSSDSATANIIIFLTDGQATVGLTNTNEILAKVSSLIAQLERKITIFTFGIGSDVNTQLLSIIAAENNGIAEFLGSDVLEQRITEFYLKIRNPVMLNTTMTFSSELISETYPSPLPNLYKGEQMLVTGLFKKTPPVTVSFNGTAYGKPVSYQYNLVLSDTAVPKYQFLPKLWAKNKIEYLLVKYYGQSPSSSLADSLKIAITNLSVSYGVLSPFTSFTSGLGTSVDERMSGGRHGEAPSDFVLLGNYPNPFNPETRIQFQINTNLRQLVVVRIYNTLGQLVRELRVVVSGAGQYEILWDGKTKDGVSVPSGSYIYVVDFGTTLLAGKMLLVK